MVDPLCGCFSYFSSRLRFYSLNNNIVKYNKWGFSFGQPENLYINLDQIERSVCNVDMVYNSPTGQEDQFSFDSFDWCRQIKDICVYKFKNHWLIKWNFKYEKSPSPNREIWRKKSAVQIPFFGRENFPDFKRLVPWTGSYELAARGLSKVKYTLLVGLKDWELFKGGKIPNHDRIVRKSMRANELIRILREPQHTHLRSSLQTIHIFPYQRVPDLNRLILVPSSAYQNSSLMRRSSQCLHSWFMLLKNSALSVHLNRVNTYQIVISSRS